MIDMGHVRRGPGGRFVAAGAPDGKAAARAAPGKPKRTKRPERPERPKKPERPERPAGAADPAGPGMELKRGRGDRVGGRPQIRLKHKGALTPEEIETFLATLAETCNLEHSARTAGRGSARIFRDLRKRDPDFAAAWDATFREAYDMLELEMAARARKGRVEDVFRNGRKVARVRVYDDAMALRLLSLHRRSAERVREADRAPRRDVNKLIDEIAARLAEIESEEAAKAAGEARNDER